MSRLNKVIYGLLFLIVLTPTLAFAQSTQTEKFYPNPGIVGYKNGKWVGSDHLYNLTNKIEVVVEIYKPDNTVLPISENMLKSRIIQAFNKAKLIPTGELSPGEPPVPFFHMLVMLYPIDKGYVGYCEGRLFEEVTLSRVELEKDTAFQAITWESENLMLSPKEDLVNQVNKSVDEITNIFIERYKFYEGIKSQLKR